MRKKIKYKISVYTVHLMEWMAQRASRRKQNWLDKRIVALLHRLTNTQKLEYDYMKDELIESEPSFDLEELEAFENSNTASSET